MRNFLRISIILAVFVGAGCSTPSTTEAKPAQGPKEVEEKTSAKKSTPTSDLKSIEKKYSQTPAFSANVRKVLKLKMLDQEREYLGSLEIKKPGMFRLEFDKPERSLAITDGKTIWVTTYPTDPDIDNTIRVIRSHHVSRVQSQTLIAGLLGKGSLLNEFKLKSKTEDKGLTTYNLDPKKKSEDVTKLQLIVNGNKKEIEEIRYWDALENETVLKLTDTKFDVSLNKERFKFEPPKGAEITDL